MQSAMFKNNQLQQLDLIQWKASFHKVITPYLKTPELNGKLHFTRQLHHILNTAELNYMT